MNIRQILTAAMLGVLLVGLLMLVPRAFAVRADGYRWFDPIVDIRSIIVDHYVHEPDEDEMQQAVIEAMIESLDDPFSQYISPEKQDEFRKDLSGNYVGIGARIHSNREWLTIITPMENSPALRAGILAGDEIRLIEGVSTKDVPVDECIDQLLGEPGTSVKVQVRHLDGTDEDIVIVREPIETRSVVGLMRRNQDWDFSIDDDRNIAYIGIEGFTERTADELRTALGELKAAGNLDGLILDVRSNPGGSLTAALETADLFIPEGTLLSIRSARPERSEKGREFKAQVEGTFADVPMIVLIDDRSASASEIVAGSLKDNDRALVLGERSFGKGSVQEVRQLDDEGGLLKFTTAYYYLPSGRSLHRNRKASQTEWGVDPSDGCIVNETVKDYTKRYDARMPWTVITSDEPVDPRSSDPEWLRETMSDPALARSLELVAHRVEHGQWPELESQDNAGDIAMRVDLVHALEARDLLSERMVELEEEITRLQGISELTEHGIELPDDVELADASLVIRDADGNVIGTWRIEEIEGLERSLSSVRLTPLEN